MRGKWNYALLAFCFSLMAIDAFAARPTEINYVKRSVTTFGTEYREYAVRCSDGKVKVITAWDRRRKWCVGTGSKCGRSQLAAAKMACR